MDTRNSILIAFDKIGILTKLGAQFKNWRERHFGLSKKKKSLFYFATLEDLKKYEDTKEKTYKGVIILKGACIYLVNHVENAKFCFEICTTIRNYFIYAPTQEALNDWISQIASLYVKIKNPAMHGYLEKRGDWNTAFKRRFFRTENDGNKNLLVYYESLQSKPKGKIELQASEILSGEGFEFSVKSKNSDRTFVLKAQNQQEREKWLKALIGIVKGEKAERFVFHLAACDDEDVKSEKKIDQAQQEKAIKEKIDRENAEKQKMEKEQADKVKINNEGKEMELEKERHEKEKLEKERLEKERSEKETLEKELSEKETLEKEQLEKERLEKERLEQEKLEKERLENERLEKERLENERLEKERLENERLENERLEKERLEKERMEKERMEKERMEKERIENDRMEKEQMDKEQTEKERMEKERIEKERLEKERLEKEGAEKERMEKERLEKERVEKEGVVKEEASSEKDRVEKEKSQETKEITTTNVVINTTPTESKSPSSDMEEEIKILLQGCSMIKIPKWGKPRSVKVSLKQEQNQWILTWASKRKTTEDAQLQVKEFTFHKGQEEGLFKKKSNRTPYDPQLCFSLVAKKRTLDLVCENAQDFARWAKVLEYLMKN